MNEFHKDIGTKTLGEYIRDERTKRKWTQERLVKELARLYETTRTGTEELPLNIETVGRWERNINNPSPIHRQLLCQIFQIKEKELMHLICNSVRHRST